MTFPPLLNAPPFRTGLRHGFHLVGLLFISLSSYFFDPPSFSCFSVPPSNNVPAFFYPHEHEKFSSPHVSSFFFPLNYVFFPVLYQATVRTPLSFPETPFTSFLSSFEHLDTPFFLSKLTFELYCVFMDFMPFACCVYAMPAFPPPPQQFRTVSYNLFFFVCQCSQKPPPRPSATRSPAPLAFYLSCLPPFGVHHCTPRKDSQ